jgi:hypothetical protein
MKIAQGEQATTFDPRIGAKLKGRWPRIQSNPNMTIINESDLYRFDHPLSIAGGQGFLSAGGVEKFT